MVELKMVDLKYANMLAKNTSLTLVEIEMLNRVQLGKPLTDVELKILRKKGLVEGRKGSVIISKPLAEQTGQKVNYTLSKGFDDEYYRDLILKALKQHGKLSRREVNLLLVNKLPDILSPEQKLSKIGNILTKLRKQGKIKVDSSRNWILA